MEKLLINTFLILATALGPVRCMGQTAPKKRIAVLDFDSAAVQGGFTSPFFQAVAPKTGKAVADLIVARLVQAGEVTVIERAALDKIIAEQNISNSDRTDALTAARIGRVLGVDGIILGAITKWDHDDKITGESGVGRFIGRGSTKLKHDIKARVEITARLVSPETAEVLAIGQGVGEIVRHGVKVDMRDSGNYAGMGMGGGVSNPIMTEALDQAVGKAAAELGKSFSTLPRYIPELNGVVADVNDAGRLVLNVGSNDGLKAGEQLQVWRPGKEIRDPVTQKLLMRDDVLLGEALVSGVNEGSSIAQFKGSEKVRVGDVVKRFPKQP